MYKKIIQISPMGLPTLFMLLTFPCSTVIVVDARWGLDEDTLSVADPFCSIEKLD